MLLKHQLKCTAQHQAMQAAMEGEEAAPTEEQVAVRDANPHGPQAGSWKRHRILPHGILPHRILPHMASCDAIQAQVSGDSVPCTWPAPKWRRRRPPQAASTLGQRTVALPAPTAAPEAAREVHKPGAVAKCSLLQQSRGHWQGPLLGLTWPLRWPLPLPSPGGANEGAAPVEAA
jgi:hypothetical protein